MKKNLSLLSFFVVAFIAQSQTLPIDFSKSTHGFNPFGGSTFNIVQDPNNTSNQVGRLENNGQDPWEGIYLDLVAPLFLDSARVIEMEVYNFTSADQIVLFKFENGSEANIEVTDTARSMGWQTLKFDFNKAKYNYTDPSSFVATGNYSKIVMFLNGGTPSSGQILLDDIRGGSHPADAGLDSVYNDLVWADEFDVNGAVDDSKWFHQTQLPAGGSWFNGELQHYTDRQVNSFIENGVLKIVAKKEVFTDQGETKNYTSARLNSKFAFTYGRIDARARMPKGNGTWPAIWALGQNIKEDGGYFSSQYGTTNWPLCGEIDVMEHWGNNAGVIHGSLHTGSSSGATVNTGKINISTVSDSFHVYSMNWSPQQISFMVDGEIYYTYNPPTKNINTWPYTEPQYMLLNIAMGGIGGAIDANFTESAMEIDYIRVYQNTNGSTSKNEISNTDSNFDLFPNPADEIINISGLNTNEFSTIRIIDVLGNSVQVVSVNQQQLKLNTSTLKSGVYFLEVQNSNYKQVKRFIKL